MSTQRFRILSIDGGGIKGIFPAAFLAAIEPKLPNQIFKYFDLIAGTSTGGIIALGLGMGLKANELLDFYLQKGSTIFPSFGKSVFGKIRGLFKTKYASHELRNALTVAFGERKLGESTTRLVIPTLNANSGRIYVYKTRHHQKLEVDEDVKVVDVALATAAAPTYLPPHISPQGIPFLDGGLWANNPTGLAVVEAVGILNQDRRNLEVLSLGCTEEPQDFSIVRGGGLQWARAAIKAAMSGQSFGSMGTAYLLAGHEHVHRVSPIVAPGRFSMDDTTKLDQLRAFGFEQAREELPRLRELFFGEPATSFKHLR